MAKYGLNLDFLFDFKVFLLNFYIISLVIQYFQDKSLYTINYSSNYPLLKKNIKVITK